MRPIVRAAEEHFQLETFEGAEERIVFRFDLRSSMRGVTLGEGEFDKHLEIGELPLDLLKGQNFRAQRRNLFDLRLGALFVCPKIRLCHRRLTVG
jgi:hypothetical protein